MRRVWLAALAALQLTAEEPLHEMGPFPTREMFPLYLPTMAYQPVDPVPLGPVSYTHLTLPTTERV